MASFNTLSNLTFLPYNIIKYLAQSKLVEVENLWKLLKYNDYDALTKPNLTFDEKVSLIWKTGKQEDYSVFLTNLIEDAVEESRCILKIYNYMIQPIDVYNAATVYAFDFLYGGTIALVEENGIPVSRADVFIKAICSALNGQSIGGVGVLALDDSLSRYSGAKSVIGNQKTFTGACLYLMTQIGTVGTDVELCDG